MLLPNGQRDTFCSRSRYCAHRWPISVPHAKKQLPQSAAGAYGWVIDNDAVAEASDGLSAGQATKIELPTNKVSW